MQRNIRVDQNLVVNVLTDMKRKLREGELKFANRCYGR